MTKILWPDRVQLNAFGQDVANIDFSSAESYTIQYLTIAEAAWNDDTGWNVKEKVDKKVA